MIKYFTLHRNKLDHYLWIIMFLMCRYALLFCNFLIVLAITILFWFNDNSLTWPYYCRSTYAQYWLANISDRAYLYVYTATFRTCKQCVIIISHCSSDIIVLPFVNHWSSDKVCRYLSTLFFDNKRIW